jgi:hypothetical protein
MKLSDVNHFGTNSQLRLHQAGSTHIGTLTNPIPAFPILLKLFICLYGRVVKPVTLSLQPHTLNKINLPLQADYPEL